MRRSFTTLLVCVLLAGPVSAQDERTLADIRQELTVLNVEVQRLKRELSTTGGPQVSVGGATVLDRVGAVEAELQRLTALTEQLEFRIGQIVEDGTRRIGDLEFRLVELEGGDVSALGETSTLGGESQRAVGSAPPTGGSGSATSELPGLVAGGGQLAVSEEADFTRAQSALAAGNYAEAAELFAQFSRTYPGGPLATGAALGRGSALEASGDTQEAARAYLDAFSGDPEGQLAAQSLFRLGRALAALGQSVEACITLAEVSVRFPGAPEATEAQQEMQRNGCG